MSKLLRCNSDNEDFRELIKLLDLDLDQRYGSLQKEYNAFNKIEFIETVVVAYNEATPIGCGCFKVFDDQSVEIKRIFVLDDYRGKGFASSILIELENWAKEKGFLYSMLETGIKQYEAINLYNKRGYNKIENFGQYIGNTNSICMKKVL